MPPVFDSTRFCRRFRFGESDCLYRDHLGRRVVAEVEGSGSFAILSSLDGIQIEIDEVPTETVSGGFQTSLVALAGPSISTDIVAGNAPLLDATPITYDREFFGCGYLLESQGQVMVDSSHRWIPEPSRGFPVPIFESVTGSGSLRILPQPYSYEIVDRFSIADGEALKQRGFQVQNISKVSILDSTFEDGVGLMAPVASHLNVARWTCEVPSGSQGLILQKTYDAFHGRQRARVFVDGTFAGWWYEPEQNRARRWRIGQFGIPKERVEGRNAVEIAIDPPAGAPLWSVGETVILSLFRSA